MDDAITVCKALAKAGIWIDLRPDTQTLILGPTPLVQAHPDLLQQVRAQKPAIMQALQETLVCDVLGTPDASRFHLEPCSDCQQSVFVITPPRRLAVHRTVDGTAVCPGAKRAQEAVAHELMQQFILERCVQRPGSQLSWMALRGGLEGWAREEGLLLPPRPYLIAWMDGHYKRTSQDETYPRWQGLTFTVREWLGDEEDTRDRPASRPMGLFAHMRNTKLVVTG